MPASQQRNYRFDPRLVQAIGLAASQEGVSETEFMRRAAKERIPRHLAGGLEVARSVLADSADDEAEIQEIVATGKTHAYAEALVKQRKEKK